MYHQLTKRRQLLLN